MNYILDITSEQVGEQVGEQGSEQLDDRFEKVHHFCESPRTRNEIQNLIGIASRRFFAENILNPLLASGQLRMTIPDKPNSRNQKYVTTKRDRD